MAAQGRKWVHFLASLFWTDLWVTQNSDCVWFKGYTVMKCSSGVKGLCSDTPKVRSKLRTPPLNNSILCPWACEMCRRGTDKSSHKRVKFVESNIYSLFLSASLITKILKKNKIKCLVLKLINQSTQWINNTKMGTSLRSRLTLAVVQILWQWGGKTNLFVEKYTSFYKVEIKRKRFTSS